MPSNPQEFADLFGATIIGEVPDVGGGRYLSRLRGRLAQFLALTGARLDGAECKALRLATHYVPSDRLEEAKERIMAQPFKVEAVLDELSADEIPEARIMGNLKKKRRLQMNKHKRKKRLKANRHKKRTWQK